MKLHKKRFTLLLSISLAAALILAVSVFFCIRQTSRKMTQYSFDELTASTKRLADEIYETANTDTTILRAMAALISEQSLSDKDALLRIMNSFDTERSFISYIDLLFPDDRLLNQKGKWKDASGLLSFEDEKEKGSYISNRMQGIWDPSNLVVRNGVPVKRGGETIAMLYGVFSLIDASQNYNANFYDDNSFVLIIDGINGEVLLDTWHETLTSLSEMGDRKTLFGDTFKEAKQNMIDGLSGDISSISKTTGQILYMHYEPVNINHWSVTLGATKETALAGTRSCTQSLYLMAVIIAVTLIVYILLVVFYLTFANRSIYQMSITDQATQLLNRSAYEKYLLDNQYRCFHAVSCIYIDANGLHEINNRLGHKAGDQMLQTVADLLRETFPSSGVYRIGGDEFIVFPPHTEELICEKLMSQIAAQLDKYSYSISYGIVCSKNILGLNHLVQEADAKMLLNKKAYYAQKERSAR